VSRRTGVAFHEACDLVGAALRSDTRDEILDATVSEGDDTLSQLRAAMQAHRFPARTGVVDLSRLVQSYDARSRHEGLHVVQGWDFKAQRFTPETAPVLLLDYCRRLEPRELPRATAERLLDQYFQTIIALLAVRAWDDGDANENFDRLGELLVALSGPHQHRRTVDDVETLFLLAVSYFHPDERCYATLLDKVRTLDADHRVRMAAPLAMLMSAHLRWGFRFMYRNDVGTMRDDNVVDYPWLLFAIATLASAHGAGDSTTEEALLVGLAADPWAFRSKRPSLLDSYRDLHTAATEWIAAHVDALLAHTALLGTTTVAYSPLAFSCNFPPNAAVSHVAASVEDGEHLPSLNVLFRSQADGAPRESPARQLAERLTKYATADPARLGAHGAPLIVYDPYDGVRAYNNVSRVLRG
jgi:hypothetical protein